MNEPKLALLGGRPVIDSPYPVGPWVDSSEHEAVTRVLDSGCLSGFIGAPGPNFLGGPEVLGLEKAWSGIGSYLDVVALNSATAGLHAGLAAMDLPLGSVVIVPPLTMSATVAAVLLAGLKARFADVDPSLFTLNAETVEKMLDDDVSAIVVVHLFGQMAPMNELRSLAASRGLKILEDAAQAPGATQAGYWPGHGTMGAVFSLNQNKVITCGEGGLLASNDPDVVERARLIRNHGESCVHAFPSVDAENIVGLNYRLTEIEAAIALAQTAKLEILNQHRIDLAARLSNRLRAVPGIEIPVIGQGNRHVYFTYALRLDSEMWEIPRSALVEALRAEGVPCAPGYVDPLFRLPLFRRFGSKWDFDPALFPVSTRIADDELILINACRWPSSNELIDKVSDAFEKCWEGRKGLRVWMKEHLARSSE